VGKAEDETTRRPGPPNSSGDLSRRCRLLKLYVDQFFLAVMSRLMLPPARSSTWACRGCPSPAGGAGLRPPPVNKRGEQSGESGVDGRYLEDYDRQTGSYSQLRQRPSTIRGGTRHRSSNASLPPPEGQVEPAFQLPGQRPSVSLRRGIIAVAGRCRRDATSPRSVGSVSVAATVIPWPEMGLKAGDRVAATNRPVRDSGHLV